MLFRNRLIPVVIGGGALAISAAQEAVKREVEALSIDFTDSYFKTAGTSAFYGSAWVKDVGTPANDFDGVPDDLLTVGSSSSPKMVLGPDGTLRYAPHNLARDTDAFSSWTKVAGSPTTTSGQADPDGGTSATLFSATSAVDTKIARSHAATMSGQQYAISIKAKYSSGSGWLLMYATNASAAQVWFDVQNGVKGTEGVNVDAATIADVGGGFYKCTIVYTATATSGDFYLELVSANNASTAGASDAIVVYNAHKYVYPADDVYMQSTSSAVYGLPYEWDANGEPLGILMEPAATNLVADSQDFSDAAWSKTNTATLAFDATGPDNVSNSAVTLVDSGATGTGVVQCQFSATVATSTDYVFSVYAKQDQLSWLSIWLGGFTSIPNTFSYYDLGNGSIGTNSLTTGIDDVGSGWYRCWVTFTSDVADTAGLIRIHVADGDADVTVDLDGTSSILIYGAQFETGTRPTSLVRTFGATQSRAIDDSNMATTAFPFDVTTGTLFVEYTPKDVATAYDALRLDDGTANEVIAIGHDASANGELDVQDGGAAQTAPLTSGTVVADATNRIAAVYAANDFAVSEGGAAAATDTSGTLPTVTTLDIGVVNGHVRKATYLPRRATDADLAAWSDTGSLP